MYTPLDKKLLREVVMATFYFPLILVAATTAAQIKYGYVASWYVILCMILIGTVLWIGGAHLKHEGNDFSKAAVSLFASSGVFIALAVYVVLKNDILFLNQEMRMVITVLALALALITHNMGHTAAQYYALPFFALKEKRVHTIETLSIETAVIALLLVTYFLFIS